MKSFIKRLISRDTNENWFRLIFENNSSAIAILEGDTTISKVNDTFCKLSGYSMDEVVGGSWTRFIHHDDLARLTEYNRHRLQHSPDVPYNYEFQYYHKNGDVRVGLMTVSYFEQESQTIASIIDITERKKNEISLKESKERFEKLIEMQGEGLGIVDTEERFVFSNPASDRIMGVPVGSLVGRRMNEFVTKSTFEQIRKQTAIRSEGQQSTYEMEITRPDGETRVLLVTATPTFDSHGEFESSLGIFLDITDRKNIEDELKKNEAELTALNTTKDKLFSIIAHDLRGPIGTSADLLEVMIESYESFNSDEQLKMLEILRNSAKSTYNLLETLLNWAIIQTGNLVFKPDLFDLTKCVDNIVQNMAPSAYSKNISLTFEHGEEILTYADQNMIQTVLRNLIGNAIKYSYRGGKVEVKLSNLGIKTEISISDNGVGMDGETIKNLFIFNKQNSKYGTDNEKGTGLGLILCKEFIQRHGGNIRIESEKERGSKFIIDIPNIKPVGETIFQRKSDENLLQKKFNGELILIVEDDDINFQVLRSILSSVNLKCERAENGRKAVDMFLNNSYRLILMDIQLPEMIGWEATMKIRENDSEIPIIAVTAYSSDPTRKKSMEAGCNDFVTKPVNKIKLIQLIDKYLKTSRVNPIMYK